MPDNGSSIVAANTWLVLGDSARALAATRFLLDSLVPHTSLLETTVSNGTSYALMWPRAMLLRADLAAAAAQRDEARLWYDRFLAIWSSPDPKFMPIVERARRARASLGR